MVSLEAVFKMEFGIQDVYERENSVKGKGKRQAWAKEKVKQTRHLEQANKGLWSKFTCQSDVHQAELSKLYTPPHLAASVDDNWRVSAEHTPHIRSCLYGGSGPHHIYPSVPLAP